MEDGLTDGMGYREAGIRVITLKSAKKNFLIPRNAC